MRFFTTLYIDSNDWIVCEWLAFNSLIDAVSHFWNLVAWEMENAQVPDSFIDKLEWLKVWKEIEFDLEWEWWETMKLSKYEWRVEFSYHNWDNFYLAIKIFDMSISNVINLHI